MNRVKHLAGKFIVFDGGEGCGKSTQAALLKQDLESAGMQVLAVHDPGATRIGELIRAILLNPDNTDMAMRCEMLLYMAARAQMMEEKIVPALKDGKVVISGRFVSSTLAYQLGGDGLTVEDIRAVAEIAIKGRWPDLMLILDMPTKKSAQRVQPKFLLDFPEDVQAQLSKDRIELRSFEYHEDVRRKYLDQVKRDPKRYRVINADRDVEKVHQDVLKQVGTLK
ncbi:dTMP kinase [soil metagenome]